MKEVNADLYEFLRSNDTGLSARNGEVIAHVIVDFYDLKEFIQIVGKSWFSDGSVQVTLCDTYVGIEVNEIIENQGHYLSSYKNCFCLCDWEVYKEKIMAAEC